MPKYPTMKVHQDYNCLETATDSEKMRPRFRDKLQRLWRLPVELGDFCIPRVFPRAGDAFTIQYRMMLKRDNNTPLRPLVLCGHLLGPSESWPAYADKHSDRTFVLEDLRLVVPVFPFDPKLDRLAELCSRGETPPVLKSCYEAMGHNGSNPEVTGYEVLGYRLERRCVLRYKLGFPGRRENNLRENQVVARILRPRQAKATLGALRMLEAGGFGSDAPDSLTIPRTYHADITGGIHFMESVPGVSLHELTGDSNFSNGCEAAGRLLRKLHSLRPTELPAYFTERDLENLRARVALVYKIYPQWAEAFDQAYQLIEANQDSKCTNDQLVCIHRDFYDKQVLYSAERATLLDCDNLALGDPAQDFGNFLAHLSLRLLQEPVQAENIRQGMQAFEQAYGNLQQDFVVRVRWWQAATFLRLAILYSLRPRWRHLTTDLLRKVITSAQRGKFSRQEDV